MLRSCLLFVALRTTSAFLSPNPRPFYGGVSAVAESDGAGINGAAAVNGGVQPLMSSTTPSDSTTDSALTSSLKKLLENLDGPDGGQQLWAASSSKWQTAIVDALPAAAPADVAQSLQAAMSRPENQFAILMGKAEPFVANFPSDPVVDEDANTAWVECRLRHAETDTLLVTMGISLVMGDDDDDKRWLISALDWQDFRDAFYPGVSGREWLRAF